jgi:UPF0755 protein
MSKIVSVVLIVILLTAGILAWMIFGSGTGFGEKTQYFIVAEGKTDKASVLEAMEENHILSSKAVFSLFSSPAGIWGGKSKIRAGKYEVKKGQSMWSTARMLKNGRLAEIKLVINKLRVKEDLAKLISKNFEPDSVSVMRFLNSNDSLKQFGVDTSSVFTLIIPDTYTFYWNTTLPKIFRKLASAKNVFWEHNSRLAKAENIGFTTEQVYTSTG